MDQYFIKDYIGSPFELFSLSHLAVLAVIFGCSLVLSLIYIYSSKKVNTYIRYGLIILLIGSDISWHIWSLAIGNWSIVEHLPLHVCSIMTYIMAIALFTGNKKLYPLCYFIGLGATLQPLLTPELGIYGFPHFRFLQFFINHGALFLAPLYMIIVEKYRPCLSDILSCFIITSLYLGFVAVVNFLIGSNYVYLAQKPSISSPLDYMGPWPWYILGMEIIGLLQCFLLYLPFVIKNYWHRKP